MRRISDIVLAVFVVAIAAMLVIPLPTFLLDILLVINISISLLLLLVGLYMPNALSLLSFPSLLLLTTLFRLGLNVASTRLILSQGDAGTVIKSFGTFLVRGEVVVGIIIFCIITIVNFIVIARGSSRVSEVAARFALDALPGKQAAIDADLRAGILTPDEARARRDELRKESQLYGSMDGAMKFVQGDAIAGFFIILTNIFGGIYLGVTRGQTFAEAISTYTILTVGDGLVNQIPALLISICAGIVVTRVYSGEGSTLGSDLGQQLFARHGVLALTAGIVALLGLMPGLPTLPFLAVAAGFFVASFFLQRSRKLDSGQMPLKLDLPTGSVMLLGAPASDEESAAEQSVEIILDSAVLHKLYRQQSHHYTAWWQELRADFLSDLGMRLPDTMILNGDGLAPSTFSVSFGGSVVCAEEIQLDSIMIEVLPESAALLGLTVLKEGIHPVTGSRVIWAARTEALRLVTDAAELRTYDFMEYIGLKVAAYFMHHPEEIFTLTDVHSGLKQLEKRYPGLASDVFSRHFLDVPRLTEVFQELIRQGLNVRDFKQVVESVASYCSTNGISVADSSHVSLPDIVSYIRALRRRQVVAKLLSRRGTLRVFALAEDVDRALDDITPDPDSNGLALDSDLFDSLRAGLRTLMKPLLSRGVLPVSILVRSEHRDKVQRLVNSCSEPIRVVTYNELEPGLNVERVGVWSIS